MQILQTYSNAWPQMYEKEAGLIKKTVPSFVDIQHIGSTSIPFMTSKPIIDIAALIESSFEAEKYTKPLESLGYKYYPESSSSERYFFRKGNPAIFHLSLCYKDRGTFWERQLSFRDYLRTNQESREEYIKLKQDLLKKDPKGGKAYLSGKTDFVESILEKSKMRHSE